MSEKITIEDLIYIIKKIYRNLALQLEKYLKHENTSGIQGYLLVYILRHHLEGTYITELCHETGLSKPSMSELIKKLRINGYLYFEENPEDIRKKKLLPSKKLLLKREELLQRAEKMELSINRIMDSMEIAELWKLEQKLEKELKEMECNNKK